MSFRYNPAKLKDRTPAKYFYSMFPDIQVVKEPWVLVLPLLGLVLLPGKVRSLDKMTSKGSSNSDSRSFQKIH